MVKQKTFVRDRFRVKLLSESVSEDKMIEWESQIICVGAKFHENIFDNDFSFDVYSF